MTATAVVVGSNPLAGKSLVDEVLWDRLVGRVVQDHDFKVLFGDETAEEQRLIAARIMDQTIGFLELIATGGGPYSPSEQIDIGWHTFLAYTREYADFCQRVAGRMIHHEPSDVPGVAYERGSAARTAAAMKVRGMYVDEELWVGAASCQNYCTGDSCAGSTCNGE